MIGMLYTSYFSMSKKLEGKRIAVCRFLPKWAEKGRDYDEWWPELAPSPTLLRDYKTEGVSYQDYTTRYLKEQCRRTEGLVRVRKALLNGETLSLMCLEAPLDKEGNKVFCHRNIIRQIAVRNRFLALEYTTTTVPREAHENLMEFLQGRLNEITLPNNCTKEVISIVKVANLRCKLINKENTFTLVAIK